MSACWSRRPDRASYLKPQTGVAIVVERRPAHGFLAEYDRRTELIIDGRKAAEAELFKDTGGDSRLNLYRISDTVFLLRDAADSYAVDLDRRTITQDDVRRKEGFFVGSYDLDSSQTWRFIPSGERPELATEFKGG